MRDKRAPLTKILPKLAKLLPLLASDQPGEVFNTAQAIARLLATVKLDLHDVVTFVAGEMLAVPADDQVNSDQLADASGAGLWCGLLPHAEA